MSPVQIDADFEVREFDLPTDLRCAHCDAVIVRHVIRLFRNGQQVVDPDGKPVDYPSVDDATYVARHWPTYGGSLRDLTDEQLLAKARRIAVLDQERVR